MERLSYFQSVEQKYDRLIIDHHPTQDIFSGKHCTAEEDCGGECREGACALPLSKEAKSLRRTESPILLSSHFVAIVQYYLETRLSESKAGLKKRGIYVLDSIAVSLFTNRERRQCYLRCACKLVLCRFDLAGQLCFNP